MDSFPLSKNNIWNPLPFLFSMCISCFSWITFCFSFASGNLMHAFKLMATLLSLVLSIYTSSCFTNGPGIVTIYWSMILNLPPLTSFTSWMCTLVIPTSLNAMFISYCFTPWFVNSTLITCCYPFTSLKLIESKLATMCHFGVPPETWCLCMARILLAKLRWLHLLICSSSLISSISSFSSSTFSSASGNLRSKTQC